MSRETWVQEYATGHSPGPDGEPVRVNGHLRDVRELLVQMHDEYHPAARIFTRDTTRHNGRIRQHWRRIR